MSQICKRCKVEFKDEWEWFDRWCKNCKYCSSATDHFVRIILRSINSYEFSVDNVNNEASWLFYKEKLDKYNHELRRLLSIRKKYFSLTGHKNKKDTVVEVWRAARKKQDEKNNWKYAIALLKSQGIPAQISEKNPILIKLKLSELKFKQTIKNLNYANTF